MALMELSFSDLPALEAQGRTFDCTKCDVQHIRRCEEDREDFTAEDGNVFPLRINDGGPLYGFCPSKAAWNPANIELMRLLVAAVESGTMPEGGGLMDQTAEWIALYGWFAPTYQSMKLMSYARAFAPDKKTASKPTVGPNRKALTPGTQGKGTQHASNAGRPDNRRGGEHQGGDGQPANARRSPG